MNGLLNINKPAGAMSRDIVDQVCRIAGTRQVGHAGTLDPLATGVLVVCVGWTTRLVPFIQQLRKTYVAEFLLGQTSDTDDVTGHVKVVHDVSPPTRAQIEETTPAFVGRIQQVPPQYSAVRVSGRRAHHLARQGADVALTAREVEVHRFEILEYAFPRLRSVIECGSGTYVRSIGRDLGQALGCGALMSALTRTAVGPFTIDEAVRPDDLSPETISSRLLAPQMGVAHLPNCRLTDDQLAEVGFGRAFPFRGESLKDGTTVALVGAAGDLIALAEFQASRQVLQPRQVFIRRPV